MTSIQFIKASQEPEILQLPLFADTVPCGFPSPAQDYVEAELDLNDYCILRPSSTYFKGIPSFYELP